MKMVAAPHEFLLELLASFLRRAHTFATREKASPPNDRKLLAGLAVLVAKMPANSRKNVALNQHRSSVVPPRTMCKLANGMCSTLGKPQRHFLTDSSLCCPIHDAQGLCA